MTVLLHAQSAETLTNGSIIKLTKARLSEELIIDMIKTSPVSFDLSSSGLKNLMEANVTLKVIDVMKSTAGSQTSNTSNQISGTKSASSVTGKPVESGESHTTTNAVQDKTSKPEKLQSKEPKEQPIPVKQTEPVTDKVLPPASESKATASPTQKISVEAYNYVSPLVDLIKFHENEISSLEKIISDWDKQVRNYVIDINSSEEQMTRVENELRQKKNADTKSFGNDITALKGTLKTSREKYRESKDRMLKGGEEITKKLDAIKNDRLHSLGKAYSEAGQDVESSNSGPSVGEIKVTFEYTGKNINTDTSGEIVYVTEMLTWYQNEILNLIGIINNQNPKVRQIIQDDAALKKQLDPLEEKLNQLKTNAKQNKTEISSLKKEISRIEKDRNKLSDKMKDESKELASNLKQISQKNEDSVKERFTDIIENITYSFQEKLSLK